MDKISRLFDLKDFSGVLGCVPRLNFSVPGRAVIPVSRSLEILGKKEEAYKFLCEVGLAKVLRKLCPDTQEVLCDLGRLAYEAHRIDESTKWYLQAREADPMDWEPHFRLGIIHMKEHVDFERAFSSLVRSYRTDKKLLTSRLTELQDLLRKGKKEDFCFLYTNLRLIQDIVDEILLITYVEPRLKRTDSEIQRSRVKCLQQRLLRLSNRDTDLVVFVATVHLDHTDTKAAKSLIKEGLRREPEHSFGNLSMSAILVEEGRLDLAKLHLTASLRSATFRRKDFDEEFGLRSYYSYSPSRYVLDALNLMKRLRIPTDELEKDLADRGRESLYSVYRKEIAALITGRSHFKNATKGEQARRGY